MKLSLVVPCYNEQDNVRAFYDAVAAAFKGCGYDYELVMVNDGSRDETGPELKRLFQEKKDVSNMTMHSVSASPTTSRALLWRTTLQRIWAQRR